MAGPGVALHAHKNSHVIVQRDIGSIDAKLVFDAHIDNANSRYAGNPDSHVIVQRDIGSIDAKLDFNVHIDNADSRHDGNLEHCLTGVLRHEHCPYNSSHAHTAATRTSNVRQWYVAG